MFYCRKKIISILKIKLFFIVVISFQSCSSEHRVVNNSIIQKREYCKGFFYKGAHDYNRKLFFRKSLKKVEDVNEIAIKDTSLKLSEKSLIVSNSNKQTRNDLIIFKQKNKSNRYRKIDIKPLRSIVHNAPKNNFVSNSFVINKVIEKENRGNDWEFILHIIGCILLGAVILIMWYYFIMIWLVFLFSFSAGGMEFMIYLFLMLILSALVILLTYGGIYIMVTGEWELLLEFLIKLLDAFLRAAAGGF